MAVSLIVQNIDLWNLTADDSSSSPTYNVEVGDIIVMQYGNRVTNPDIDDPYMSVTSGYATLETSDEYAARGATDYILTTAVYSVHTAGSIQFTMTCPNEIGDETCYGRAIGAQYRSDAGGLSYYGKGTKSTQISSGANVIPALTAASSRVWNIGCCVEWHAHTHSHSAYNYWTEVSDSWSYYIGVAYATNTTTGSIASDAVSLTDTASYLLGTSYAFQETGRRVFIT